jgi:hypothetical protein
VTIHVWTGQPVPVDHVIAGSDDLAAFGRIVSHRGLPAAITQVFEARGHLMAGLMRLQAMGLPAEARAVVDEALSRGERLREAP